MLGKIVENKGQGAKYIVRFKKVFKRFSNLNEAEAFLSHLRVLEHHGSFDERDYQKDQPMGFTTLSRQWLDRKKVRCKRNLINDMRYAQNHFGNKNIKEIDYPELDDFFDHESLAHLTDKSRYNIKGTLTTFWKWVVMRNRKARVKIDMPVFPDIDFELDYRQTVDKGTQSMILDEIKRISYHINPKIYIGCLWLSTYVNVRPIEIIHVKEEDINNGIMLIKHNKEKKSKKVYLLPEDVEIIKSFPTALPHLYFFRHGIRKGVAKTKRGQFGKDYLYTWWRKACKNLGVDGVPLYPGTKHSTVIALGDTYTPEQIKKYGTGHATNKAFDRYFQVDAAKKRDLFVSARCTTAAQRKASNDKAEVIEIPIKNGAEGGT